MQHKNMKWVIWTMEEFSYYNNINFQGINFIWCERDWKGLFWDKSIIYPYFIRHNKKRIKYMSLLLIKMDFMCMENQSCMWHYCWCPIMLLILCIFGLFLCSYVFMNSYVLWLELGESDYIFEKSFWSYIW